MTHKFKIGDIVKCRSIPEFQEGEITCDERAYKMINGDISNIYDVKIGYEIKTMIEEGLEKMEEPSNTEQKYNVGDRVIFYFTPDEVKIGVIEEIDTHNTYKILFGDLYYIIPEKDIIDKSEIKDKTNPAEEEFKEGDEVWVKGNIIRWDNGDILCSSGLKIHIPHEGITWEPVYLNKNTVFKSIPPKNEWVSVKDKFPPDMKSIHIFTRNHNQHIGIYTQDMAKVYCGNESGESYYVPSSIITHWKPLDAPPTE